jgi:RNA polymerase-binding transcription factor DksA
VANDASPAEAAAIDYRALLEQERGSLARQLEESGLGGVSHIGLSSDPMCAVRSLVRAVRGVAEALAAELRNSLAEVERAIARFDAGTFGTCQRCGQPISPARLEAKPAVTTCISCASLPR